jgi:uncharacterized membrane protein HdeD (DUF308 family)
MESTHREGIVEGIGAELLGDISTKVKSGGRRMTLFGIISIVLGMGAITAPAITGLSVVMMVGLLMTAGGIMKMLWAFAAENFGKGVLALAMGGLTLLCGLSMAGHPIFASAFLTLIIAGFLFAEGVAEIAGAFRLNPDSGRVWMLAGGITSMLLGAMIWRQFPLSGVWAIGVLLGVKLLISGTVMLAVGSAGRGLAKRMNTAA